MSDVSLSAGCGVRVLQHSEAFSLSCWLGQAIHNIQLVNGLYSSIDAVDTQTVFSSYFNVLLPEHLDLTFAGSLDALATVTLINVEHPFRGYGLASAISAVDSNTIYITYVREDRVRLAASFDGGTGWRQTIVVADPNAEFRTAVKAFASGTIYSAYFTGLHHLQGSLANLAKSEDQGSTWTLMRVPEPRAVGGFLDLAVPQEGRAFLSYTAGGSGLKLATFDE